MGESGRTQKESGSTVILQAQPHVQADLQSACIEYQDLKSESTQSYKCHKLSKLRIINPHTQHCRITNPAEHKGSLSIHCRIANLAEHNITSPPQPHVQADLQSACIEYQDLKSENTQSYKCAKLQVLTDYKPSYSALPDCKSGRT